MPVEKLDNISINIWDDFSDDPDLLEGHIISTYAYVEEYDEMTDEEKEEAIEIFYNHIKDMDVLKGVKVIDGSDEVHFEHITHKILDDLMEKLEHHNLSYKGKPFSIYSES